MKSTMIIRSQMILMAVIAGLLLFAGSAYAQQEMDPTSFPDGPFVTNYAQPQVTIAQADANSTFTMDATNSAGWAPAVATDGTAVEEAGVGQLTTADVWSMNSLVLAMGLLVLYGALEDKRENSERRSGSAALNPSVAAAH